MQRNLNRGLSLTFSLGLLLVTVSACSDASGSKPSATTEAESSHHVAQGTSQKENLPTRTTADAGEVKEIGVKSDHANSVAFTDENETFESSPNRSQIKVPPPPLGIVPVTSSRSRTATRISAADEEAMEPAKVTLASQKTDKTVHRSAERASASARQGEAEQLPSPSRMSSTKPSSRFTTATTSGTRSPAGATGSMRKREPTEQELRAQKIIHERAAQMAKQRQARLAIRRYGNASRYSSRGLTQTAQSRPNSARTSTAIGAETAQSQ